MAKHFVLVAGNIGTGKTSLAAKLGERLGWEAAYESVEDNPYLADFYGNMQKWAFHLQVFFLGHRARQHLQLARSPRSTIIDRSIYEDAEIFAKAALEIGSVTERDYRTYRQVFDLVVGTLPTPDLLIFLRAELPVLVDRIGRRGRDMERGISIDYLSLLERLYLDWMANFDLCPTLTIRTDDLDFVHEPRHLAVVESRIRDKLAGKEEIAFPPE